MSARLRVRPIKAITVFYAGTARKRYESRRVWAVYQDGRRLMTEIVDAGPGLTVVLDGQMQSPWITGMSAGDIARHYVRCAE